MGFINLRTRERAPQSRNVAPHQGDRTAARAESRWGRRLRAAHHAIELVTATAVFCAFLVVSDDKFSAASLTSQASAASLDDLNDMFNPPLVLIDANGDGVGDLANPAGVERAHDMYGSGEFGASRDGGKRKHRGVDYDAAPGATIHAPVSGIVKRFGFAYDDDKTLKFVEIADPALQMVARVFYVDCPLAIGQVVAAGDAIGTAQSLAARYPLITNHVHVEMDDGKGRHLDPSTILPPADSPYLLAMRRDNRPAPQDTARLPIVAVSLNRAG